MNDFDLKRVQSKQLQIASQIKRICDSHGIKYFMDSGTLLGAVRHGGFIPWDDDFDIGMMRSDYDKFLSIADRELGEEYFVQNWFSDENYGKPFTKVRLIKTQYIEKNANPMEKSNGIFVDILPYDRYPENLRKGLIFNEKLRVIRFLVQSKINSVRSSTIKEWLGVLISSFTSRNFLINMYEKACRKYNSKKGSLMYAQTGTAKLGTWRIKETILSDLIEVKFENTSFSAPKKYHEYLLQAYGDYMKLPPVGERVGGHDVIGIKL